MEKTHKKITDNLTKKFAQLFKYLHKRQCTFPMFKQVNKSQKLYRPINFYLNKMDELHLKVNFLDAFYSR